MKYTFLFLFTLLLTISSCKKEDTPDLPGSITPTNILLIIADDVGKDALPGFVEGTEKPSTPNLDAIRDAGLNFTNFWSYPTCSPTRASIITGKYGYRTGVKGAGDVLSTDETILQEYIDNASGTDYASAIIGKWHLSGNNNDLNPETYGFDHFSGINRGAVQNYYSWQLRQGDDTGLNTDYCTEVFTDLAIDWVNQQSQPWFLWMAYNAAHTPFHAPPVNMHQQGNLPEYVDGMDAMPYYLAAIEALDFQIGRLLNAIPSEQRDNTLVLFIGDNGTPNQVAQAPFASSKAKGTLYQGGVNVPFYASGQAVNRIGTDDNLITSTDLFCTIAQIAGVDQTAIHDSQSFAHLLDASGTHRQYQYTESTDGWAISDGTYKLHVQENGNEELYQLSNDPYESENLMDNPLSAEANTAKEALEAELLNIRQ